MRSLNRKTLSIIGTVATFVYFSVLATSAHAVPFNFSYEWASGGKVEGMFVGDIAPDGNTVTVSEVMATYFCCENSGSGLPIFSRRSSGAGMATFDGSNVAFGGFDPSRSNTLLRVTNEFTEILISPGVHSLEAEGEPFDASRWHLEQKQEVIPEPRTIILFGTGMLGLLAWAHRKKNLETT